MSGAEFTVTKRAIQLAGTLNMDGHAVSIGGISLWQAVTAWRGLNGAAGMGGDGPQRVCVTITLASEPVTANQAIDPRTMSEAAIQVRKALDDFDMPRVDATPHPLQWRITGHMRDADNTVLYAETWDELLRARDELIMCKNPSYTQIEIHKWGGDRWYTYSRLPGTARAHGEPQSDMKGYVSGVSGSAANPDAGKPREYRA